MKGKITLIGCPKLDDADYADKLTAIIRDNGIRSVTIVRMEVPCCGGLERAARKALQNSGKSLPCQVVTVSRDGKASGIKSGEEMAPAGAGFVCQISAPEQRQVWGGV